MQAVPQKVFQYNHDLDKKVSSRIALDWSNKPVGLLITVDGQKRLIPSSAMQILT